VIDRSHITAKRLVLALALGVLTACGGSPSGPTAESSAAVDGYDACYTSVNDCPDESCKAEWNWCDPAGTVCCNLSDVCICYLPNTEGGGSCGKMCSHD
jgi:hypothetical protein